MQFYTFYLDEESSKPVTIITPFGIFSCNRVPMGLKTAPGFAQARIEEVLRDIDEDIEIYIDDIEVFTESWEKHLAILTPVLSRLEENGFTANPRICEWDVNETEWLGYWLAPEGLKPWSKKDDAVLKITPPTNATELRNFWAWSMDTLIKVEAPREASLP